MLIKELENALNSILLGKEDVVRLALTCMFANGHLLLEDIPGMGKTTLSHALAHFLNLQFRRIQFTSDLLPADLLGVSIFNIEMQNFKFHRGPIFAQFILADEINRAPPKTQSALLEAMEERQISTDIATYPLPEPFFVIATQNPINSTGTYFLPESQLDRFLMRLCIGYPNAEAERMLLVAEDPYQKLSHEKSVASHKDLLLWQEKSQQVVISEIILDYIQNILKVSRDKEWFIHGLSPRAGKAIIKASKAYAYICERDFVRAEDVQAIIPAVINHRLVFKQADSANNPSDLILNHVEVPI